MRIEPGVLPRMAIIAGSVVRIHWGWALTPMVKSANLNTISQQMNQRSQSTTNLIALCKET